VSQVLSLFALALVGKLLAGALLGRLLTRRCGDLLEGFVAGWLFVQLGLMAAMFGLSLGGHLTGAALWAALTVASVGLAIAVWRGDDPNPASEARWLDNPLVAGAILAAVAAFGVLSYRGLYFFDSSREGVLSGVPRILFYAQHRSLFAAGPAPLLAADWNAELNGLFYVLTTGDPQAMNLGNAEVFLVACVGYAWLAGVFGAPPRYWLALGVAAATVPPLAAHHTTVQGDALAALTLPLAVGWLVRAFASGEVRDRLTAVAAAALALGSRPTVAPAACAVVAGVALAAWFAPRLNVRGRLLAVSLAVAMLAVGGARSLLNRAEYETWSPRDAMPAVTASGERLPALAAPVPGDYGVTGWGFVVVLGLTLAAGAVRWRAAPVPGWPAGLAVAGAGVLIAAGTPRILGALAPMTPWKQLALLAAAGAACRVAPGRVAATTAVGLLAVAAVNLALALPTEELSGRTFREAWEMSRARRMMVGHERLVAGPRPGDVDQVVKLLQEPCELAYDAPPWTTVRPPRVVGLHEPRVLVYAAPGMPIGFLYAPELGRWVDLCDTPAALAERAGRGEHDLVVVARRCPQTPWETALCGADAVLAREYRVAFENARYRYYRPNRDR
jgi:hypothetical protein